MAQKGCGVAGFTRNSGPEIFNPDWEDAGSLAASNQKNIMDARTATAANRANLLAGGMKMFGSLGSAAIGQIG